MYTFCVVSIASASMEAWYTCRTVVLACVLYINLLKNSHSTFVCMWLMPVTEPLCYILTSNVYI